MEKVNVPILNLKDSFKKKKSSYKNITFINLKKL
jgi:hypothetical protein